MDRKKCNKDKSDIDDHIEIWSQVKFCEEDHVERCHEDNFCVGTVLKLCNQYNELCELSKQALALIVKAGCCRSCSCKRKLMEGFEKVGNESIDFLCDTFSTDENGDFNDSMLNVFQQALLDNEAEVRKCIKELVYNGELNPIAYYEVVVDAVRNETYFTNFFDLINQETYDSIVCEDDAPNDDIFVGYASECLLCLTCSTCIGCLAGGVVAGATAIFTAGALSEL